MSEETGEFEGSDTVVHEVDLAEIELGTITRLVQEGNYLVGMTDTGVRFRQHVPVGKILDRVEGRYVLRDIAM